MAGIKRDRSTMVITKAHEDRVRKYIGHGRGVEVKIVHRSAVYQKTSGGWSYVGTVASIIEDMLDRAIQHSPHGPSDASEGDAR